jgi:hypothetical protein
MALAGPSAPVLVRLRPNSQPEFEMLAGAGPNDPQMKMVLNEMKMEVFIAIDRRFVRAFAVLMDIDMALQLSPESNEEGQSVLVVQVADGPNVGNFDVVYDEPVAGSDLGDTLPALVDLVLGNFLQDSLRFELDLAQTLSDALGTPVSASIDQVEVRGASGDELIIYADLAVGQTLPSTLSYLPGVAQIDPSSLLRATPRGLRASGELRMQMQNYVGLEYSYRVDGGPWRVWQRADDQGWFSLRQPKLGLVAKHRIEMRARPTGDWHATPKTMQSFNVETVAAAPILQLDESRRGWAVRVIDGGGSGSISLLVRWAEDDDLEPLESDFIERSSLPAGSRVEIIAVDSFGRRSLPARISVANPGASAQATPAPANGCSSQATGWLMLLGLCALRRRSGARMAR